MHARLVGGKLLRCGYTTGSSAAAAAKAATTMLLTQVPCMTVCLQTPRGIVLNLDVLSARYGPKSASCAVQKDSGDDPDVTNGYLVYAQVEPVLGAFEIVGGEGIGRVTKAGLDQAVGAYAINSVPRRMIQEACEAVCKEYGYEASLRVKISIPGGEALAARTFNPRMGIVGGISVLGTSGIVEPMSERAIVDTIRAELSLLSQAGQKALLLSIGNYGEAYARDKLRLSLTSHVKCSNFIGDTLAIAAEMGFTSALLVAHLGKLVKLGIGITNTHSSHGDGRIETLIASALAAGASLEMLHQMQDCVSTDSAIDCLKGDLLEKTMRILSERIEATLQRQVAAHLETGFICFSGMGKDAKLCFKSQGVEKLLEVFVI